MNAAATVWGSMALLLVVLATVVATALVIAARRWASDTDRLRARLEAARHAIAPTSFDSVELMGLPGPVQRYLRAAIGDGQRIIAAVTVEHTGTLNMSEAGERWKPFTSTQRIVTQRPGFDWDGRIALMPGVTARVHDAYIAGEGILRAALCGLIPLAESHGTPEIARGELMRFLAEAAWYPTALLPSQGVEWKTRDETSALATLRDGVNEVTLLFRFNRQDLIESIHADARGRSVAGAMVPTPWEGRWSHYEVRCGMQIPTQGEVTWVLGEGSRPYWRGRIETLVFEYAT